MPVARSSSSHPPSVRSAERLLGRLGLEHLHGNPEVNEHVVALPASGTNASGTILPQPSRPVRAPPSSQASSSTSIEPRHISPAPRPRRSRAPRPARSERSRSSSSTASTTAPSAIVPRAESRKCSRKCSGVKCDSAPRRTDTFVTPVAPSDSATPRIRADQVAHQRLLVHPASSSTSSTARSTPSCARAAELGSRAECLALDPEDDDARGQPADRARELDRLADPERMRRRAELAARKRLGGRRRSDGPSRAPRRTRRHRRGALRPLPPRRRSAASARARRRRPRARRARAPARASRPRGRQRRHRGTHCRCRSRRSGSLRARSPGRGSASRTRCTGRVANRLLADVAQLVVGAARGSGRPPGAGPPRSRAGSGTSAGRSSRRGSCPRRRARSGGTAARAAPRSRRSRCRLGARPRPPAHPAPRTRRSAAAPRRRRRRARRCGRRCSGTHPGRAPRGRLRAATSRASGDSRSAPSA